MLYIIEDRTTSLSNGGRCLKKLNLMLIQNKKMEERYERNRLYIDSEEQKKIKDYPIILGGSGIGSVIAECALRLGFENITIIDGDEVELSNLNRQNYTEKDIQLSKVKALYSRLKNINSEANIKIYNAFINKDNIEGFIKGHKIAINALDFASDIPLEFDRICKENDIPVIHPYNLGWGGLVMILTSDSIDLSAISKENEKINELTIVEYMSSRIKLSKAPQNWIDQIIEKYKSEKVVLSPPQLSIASWTVAAMCTHLLFNIATGKEVKKFPEYYFSTILNS